MGPLWVQQAWTRAASEKLIRNQQVTRQAQPIARARLLHGRHSARLRVLRVWDLPAGAGRARQLHGVLGAIVNDWTVSSLVTLQSGVPIAVTQATNFNAFAGFGVQRPNLVGAPTLPADQRTPTQWFNTAAFTVAPQFTIGSASRNPVRAPSYRDVYLGLMRRISVGSRQAIELRAQIFNLLNTPSFGAPAAFLGAANFGTITSAGDPRVVQLALKFVF
jgi:hypothetical protein